MHTVMFTGSPLDGLGRLVHEDDPAAQMALATAQLELALAEAGRRPADLTGLRVMTTDPEIVTAVLDVLTERLDVVYAAPLVEVVTVTRLAVPGQLLALETVLPTHHSP
jgi:enamine deaminase RidA (YjgF/YER057c/UK114 family)